jgi:adenosylhomocysteine nucleosidase
MIVVVGMKFEARIAAGLGVPVICGGDGKKLASLLTHAMAAGCGGLISFGVAGGLAPHLIPGSVYGSIAGVREPIAHADDKRRLHESTGALAVDMESHIVAEAAERHRVPLSAIRVVVDPVQRTIPRSALAGSRPDGTIDPIAVMRSLARYPRDLVGLIRLSLDTRAARATLVRGRDLLVPGLGLLDTQFVPKGVLLEGDPAPVDA